jgi:hypothetical protein
MMPDWWPAVVFGWPAIAVSMLLAVAGVAFRKPALLIVSCLVAVPFSYYLGGAESWVALAGPATVLTLLGDAYAVRRGHLRTAWYLLIPLGGFFAWLAFSVANAR